MGSWGKTLDLIAPSPHRAGWELGGWGGGGEDSIAPSRGLELGGWGAGVEDSIAPSPSRHRLIARVGGWGRDYWTPSPGRIR
jgi:hypothetical protein